MDGLALLRMLGGLGLVLGALAGALWLVRRYDIRLPGRFADADDRRIALIERLPVDAKRSLLLLRRDGVEHLLLLAPEGSLLVEAGIVADDVARPASGRRRSPPLAFAALLGSAATARGTTGEAASDA